MLTLNAEEITEWRKIIFSAPASDFSFEISTCGLSQPIPPKKDIAWSGKIEPCYNLITNDQWLWGECSITTLKYAYSLTHHTKSKEVEFSDCRVSPQCKDKKIYPKYIFSAYTNINLLSKHSYQGYLTEEEFITLANMLLEDVRSIKTKRGGVVNTAQVEGFIEYFTKKLDELSKLKKSAKPNQAYAEKLKSVH